MAPMVIESGSGMASNTVYVEDKADKIQKDPDTDFSAGLIELRIRRMNINGSRRNAQRFWCWLF